MSDAGPNRARTGGAAPEPVDLGNGTWLLDARLAGEPGVVGVFVRTLADGRVLLIEAASGATVPTVLRGLGALGIGPEAVAGIVVTHVHLDHAAGAGGLAAWADAPVYVHPDGAAHLHDPSRLWKSAARLYGDAMDALWGPMRPVPQDLLHPLPDGRTLTVGDTPFRVLHTPGHARHHLSLIDDRGDAFVGDAAGIRLHGVPRIRPALPPPETDLEAMSESLDRLRAEDPQRLLLTHFGAYDDVAAHLTAAGRRARAWGDAVLEGLRAGEDVDALTRRMERLEDQELDADGVRDPALRRRFKGSSDAAMTAAGLARYWRKLRPDALAHDARDATGRDA